MGVIYAPAFDLRALRVPGVITESSFSLTLASAGLTSVTITAADFTTYDAYTADPMTWHNADGLGITATVNHEGVSMFAEYLTLPFSNALAAVANAKILAASPNPWTGESIAIGFSNGLYSASGSVSFSMTWNNDPSRALMGFAANSGAATSHVGTYTPTYWIEASQDGRSVDREGDYEPAGIAALAINDDASAHAGVSRTTSPKYRDWVQQHEIVEKVFKSRRATSRPFTYEALFEHCRTRWPFLVDDGVELMVCVFLSEGSVFANKQRAGGVDDDVAMHVPFRVWRAGLITPGG